MWRMKVGPLQYRVVRSETVQTGGSQLTLLARVISCTRRRAAIGQGDIKTWGLQYVNVAPVAVVAEQSGWRRLLPIVDLTGMIVWALAGVCLASYVASRAAGRALEEPLTTDE
jgi:SH3-like domain-containing protein